MRSHPVYPFRWVLRALRQEAGLTVLGAAEATRYVKYERWESGQTAVGSQHLRSIAEAFGVADELFLLAYGWLLDRFSPAVGAATARVTEESLRRVARAIADEVIDLSQDPFVEGAVNHLDLAVYYLISRYRPVALDEDAILLPPARRVRPGPGAGRNDSVLLDLYGDVIVETSKNVGEQMILGGFGQGGIRLRLPPAFIEEMAEAARRDGPSIADKGIAGFSARCTQEADLFIKLSAKLRKGLTEMLRAATGDEPSETELDRVMASAAAGDLSEIGTIMMTAAQNGVTLPAVDDELTKQLQAMMGRLDASWKGALTEELSDATASASGGAILDAINQLRSAG